MCHPGPQEALHRPVCRSPRSPLSGHGLRGVAPVVGRGPRPCLELLEECLGCSQKLHVKACRRQTPQPGALWEVRDEQSYSRFGSWVLNSAVSESLADTIERTKPGQGVCPQVSRVWPPPCSPMRDPEPRRPRISTLDSALPPPRSPLFSARWSVCVVSGSQSLGSELEAEARNPRLQPTQPGLVTAPR